MKIKLEKHKTKWKNLFQIEKELIKGVFCSEKVEVEHIGSTSIPGVSSKPIIDIMVGVQHENQLDSSINKILDLGYVYVKIYEKFMPNRRYFFKLKDNNIIMPQIVDFPDDATKYDSGSCQHQFHIHMVKINSYFWRDHLLFRDYLRKNRDHMIKYDKLKNNLSKKEWNNINEYTQAKSFFIMETLKKAQKS